MIYNDICFAKQQDSTEMSYCLHLIVCLEVNITTFLCYLAVWQNIYRCKSFLRIELNVFVINRELANNICLLIFFMWDLKKIIICRRASYVV